MTTAELLKILKTAETLSDKGDKPDTGGERGAGEPGLSGKSGLSGDPLRFSRWRDPRRLGEIVPAMLETLGIKPTIVHTSQGWRITRATYRNPDGREITISVCPGIHEHGCWQCDNYWECFKRGKP